MKNKCKITIIKPLSVDVEVDIQTSIYCNDDTAYLIGDKDHWGSIAELKSLVNKYKSRYENVLKGLRYFEKKCTRNKEIV